MVHVNVQKSLQDDRIARFSRYGGHLMYRTLTERSPQRLPIPDDVLERKGFDLCRVLSIANPSIFTRRSTVCYSAKN